jgi:hypothetical protein
VQESVRLVLANAVAALVLAAGEGAEGTEQEHEERFAGVLREIAGNPFGLDTFEPAWRTSTTMQLARHVYESRDYSVLPILADALQDTGCDDECVLTHCRDTDITHQRGCWAVDLVLGNGVGQ